MPSATAEVAFCRPASQVILTRSQGWGHGHSRLTSWSHEQCVVSEPLPVYWVLTFSGPWVSQSALPSCGYPVWAPPLAQLLESSPTHPRQGEFPKCVGLEAWCKQFLKKWPFINESVAASKDFKSSLKPTVKIVFKPLGVCGEGDNVNRCSLNSVPVQMQFILKIHKTSAIYIQNVWFQNFHKFLCWLFKIITFWDSSVGHLFDSFCASSSGDVSQHEHNIFKKMDFAFKENKTIF